MEESQNIALVNNTDKTLVSHFTGIWVQTEDQRKCERKEIQDLEVPAGSSDQILFAMPKSGEHYLEFEKLAET